MIRYKIASDITGWRDSWNWHLSCQTDNVAYIPILVTGHIALLAITHCSENGHVFGRQQIERIAAYMLHKHNIQVYVACCYPGIAEINVPIIGNWKIGTYTICLDNYVFIGNEHEIDAINRTEDDYFASLSEIDRSAYKQAIAEYWNSYQNKQENIK